MQIVFLGTASCFPTPHRGVSCTGLRFEDGSTWLFDCGEGSQIKLQQSVLKIGKLTKIFITHLHGDHLFGLPGLVCTIGGHCPDRPNFVLEIYGPLGLRKFLRQALSLSRSPLPFSYVVHELVPVEKQYPEDWTTWEVNHLCNDSKHPQEIIGRDISSQKDVWDVFSDEHVSVKAGPVLHRVPCFGYVVSEKDKPGALLVNKLEKLGILPGPMYGQLKKGKSIKTASGEVVDQFPEKEGKKYNVPLLFNKFSFFLFFLDKVHIEPSEVLGPSKKGRKITILGDTHNPSYMTELAVNSDVLIHEATMEDALKEKAITFGHSTPSMAAHFAQSICARKLILYHFSQRFRGNEKEDTEASCQYFKISVHFFNPHVKILHDEAVCALGDQTTCDVIIAEDLLSISIPHT
ncbi:Zinc phosphodiesterase ELAC protein 1 [Gryllus bimaculatus]|nr:Zinc phosphodiesterase ELAC protein 1 [Gryllus bimaculatus]